MFLTATESRAEAAGIAGLDRIAQVKLPVTDLARSVAWYRELLELRLWTEIVEDGVLRGAALLDPRGRFNIALRDRSVCASQPNLEGFDVLAFLPTSRSLLDEMVERCQRLGVAHDGTCATPAGHPGPGRHRVALLPLHRADRGVHRRRVPRRRGGRHLPDAPAVVSYRSR